MNHTLQAPKSNYVLRQTIVETSDLLTIKVALEDKRVRYLMALGLSKGVAEVMATQKTASFMF